MFLTGLASGVHCAGMCGGIVAAFSAQRGIAAAPRALLRDCGPGWGRQLAFNLGRISTYAAAGALAGGLGGAAAYLGGALAAQAALYVLANLMLVLVGLHLAGAAAWLARFEIVGIPVWRKVQPLAARLFGARTLPGVYAAGLAWGFLPCGLVYGALAAAAFAGSPGAGAAAMLAFGLGTLPNLLAAGIAAARVRASLARRPVRIAAGGMVLGFGIFGLAQASGVAESVRRGLACL